ncbi:hypothetical protein Sjap_018371 [Stephania japonica]|uniref:Uncharacterized protein n=1 Tax=Stephania japonica TaxID=461633 RepID=A0AAP0I8M6_9MAGN
MDPCTYPNGTLPIHRQFINDSVRQGMNSEKSYSGQLPDGDITTVHQDDDDFVNKSRSRSLFLTFLDQGRGFATVEFVMFRFQASFPAHAQQFVPAWSIFTVAVDSVSVELSSRSTSAPSPSSTPGRFEDRNLGRCEGDVKIGDLSFFRCVFRLRDEEM